MAEFDFAALLKQAQAMQERLKQVQEEVESKTVTAQAGGGMVQAVVDGGLRVREIRIDPALLAANDKGMLEDLVVAAVNEGLSRARQVAAEALSKVAPLPGLRIPGITGD